jgi:hypothetical protein
MLYYIIHDDENGAAAHKDSITLENGEIMDSWKISI